MAWPTSIAGNGDLYEAKNNVSTTLNGAINDSTTTVVLTDASAFPASGFVTIGAEAIAYTSKTGNSLNGVVRGADGTTAASHLDGSGASHYVVAAHHNALKDEVIAVETQLSAEMTATKEPTGFPDASTTTISVVDGTRTFTIAPTGASFDVYVAGKKYTKTSESITFTDTEGLWFFYYDISGVLTASQTPWGFDDTAQVALLYWDATNNVSLDLADERHGCTMDWATHHYLHSTVGTRYMNGLAASGYVLNSDVNANVRFAFEAGAIADEDLDISIAAQAEPAQIPVLYRNGATGLWRRAATTDYPYLTTGTGRIAYNLDTAGTWSQAEVANGDFCAYWIFATDGQNYPLVAIQGQRQDTSLANAQNNNTYASLAFGTLPYAEIKLLYRVIVQTNNTYGSTMKVRIAEVQDLRSVSNLPSATYVATDHNTLSGRSTANSHPASAITNTPAGAIAATDVQAAIDELDTEKAPLASPVFTGKLGVGTSGTASQRIQAHDSTAGSDDIVMSSTSAGEQGYMQANAGGSVDIGALSSHPLRFMVGAAEKVQIDTAGKVGIACTPLTKFQVNTATNENLGVTTGSGGVKLTSFNDAGNANIKLITEASEYSLLVSGAEKLAINTSGYITAPGVYANTDASAANVYVDSSGNLKRSTASAGGGGTVNSGTQYSLAYYPFTGTAVDDAAWLQATSAAGKNQLQIISASTDRSILSLEGSTGDPAVQFSAGAQWALGYDNSASKFVISNNDVLGTNDILRLTASSADIAAAGSVGAPALFLNADSNTGIWAPAGDTLAVSTNGAERLRISSAGSIGINNASPNYRVDIAEGNSSTNITQYPVCLTGTTTGTAAAGLGVAQAFACEASDGSVYDVGYFEFNQTAVAAGSQSVDIVLRSRQAGTFTDRLRIVGSNGYMRAIGVYSQTTASAANVYVDSSGNIMRSTSSLRYKTGVKDVPIEEANKLLDVTPVTYSSLCEGDNKEERHYGFIAEELDLLDPVLVNYKTLEDGTKVPDGVQYERVVVGLLKLVQDLTKRVKDLEAKADKPCTEPSTTTVDNTTQAADSTSSSL
jgi:hypothetical protein